MLSSDTEVVENLSEDVAEENAPDLDVKVAAWAATNKCMLSAINELLGIQRRQAHHLPKGCQNAAEDSQKSGNS